MSLLPVALKRVLSKRREARARGHIDAVAGRRLSGWAFGNDEIEVVARIEGKVVATATPERPRPDVGRSFPAASSAMNSGFMLTVPESALRSDVITQVAIKLRRPGGEHDLANVGTLSMAGAGLLRRLEDQPVLLAASGLPQGVMQALLAIWPNLSFGEGENEYIDRFKELLSDPELRSVPAIASYARFLKGVWGHSQFVEAYFPTVNHRASADGNDFHCKPNSIRELFSVAHQLYVNRSYGVDGALGEFGCFKGFSSSILSYACSALGTEMHIYDSFEGLPESPGSGYARGEYAGSLEEVRENISRYGMLEVVHFHKGFFADTFVNHRSPPLALLWMDVDLESSARDLSVVVEQLNERSAFFSHECTPELFDGSSVIVSPHPDNPIPPMISRFEELGRQLTGRFIYGHSGAFWPRNNGIPVLPNDQLMRILELC